MTPECIDYERLSAQDFYKKANIIHLHGIQWWYFNRHDLDKISQKKKIIMTLHDDRILSWNDKDNNLFPYKTTYQYNQRKKIFENLSVRYIGVSQRMSKKLLNDSIKWNNKVQTIYNGIDTNIFQKTDKLQARKKLGLPLDKTISISIAWSGSKSNLKGLHYVKKIAKQYKSDSSLLFITLWNHKSHSYDNIMELPFISQKDMALYFSAADMFLYPTLADSFGLVVAESLLCGCPIVTFKTGWVPEIVTHQNNSYVANYKNYDDLLKWFERMISHKDNLSINLDEKFSLHNMIAQYQALYLNIYNS